MPLKKVKTAGGRSDDGDAGNGKENLTRRTVLKALGIVGAGLVPLIPACHVTGRKSGGGRTKRQRKRMVSTRARAAGKISIPPIDAAAPAGTQTATFALG